MVKNFKEAAVSLGEERKKVVKQCQHVGMSRLAKSAGAAKDLNFRVFFSAKKATWQREVADFLQRYHNKARRQ